LRNGTLFSKLHPGNRVADIYFDKENLSVDLVDGRTIIVPLVWYPRLYHATPAQRKRWELIGGGHGIHWPDVDEDLETEGLLAGAPSPEYRPLRRPKKKTTDFSKNQSSHGRNPSLKKMILQIMRQRQRPVTIQEIKDDLVRSGYKPSSPNMSKSVENALRSLPEVKKASRGRYRT
jgi:hypothetical protein